jgi:hypothetical protein
MRVLSMPVKSISTVILNAIFHHLSKKYYFSINLINGDLHLFFDKNSFHLYESGIHLTPQHYWIRYFLIIQIFSILLNSGEVGGY